MKGTVTVKRRMLLAFLLAVSLLVLGMPAYAQDGPDRITATYTFANIPLATLQNTILPGSLANDRGFWLGGVGSDMWHGPSDPLQRGLCCDGPWAQWPDPRGWREPPHLPGAGFHPADLAHPPRGLRATSPCSRHCRWSASRAGPVTGLSNQARDEKPYDYAAQNTFELNPSGLDTEGLVRTASGDFWLVDEYSPSLLHVDASGQVVQRFVPEGIALEGADYPVAHVAAGIYGQRKGNRCSRAWRLAPMAARSTWRSRARS